MKRDQGRIREWQRRSVEAQRERARAEHDYPVRRIGRNRERSREARERDFGDKASWVKTLPCLACSRTPSEPHHYPSRGAGGTSKDLVPLCREHHREFHSVGAETFQSRHSLDLTAEAEHLERAWQERVGCE